MTGQQAAPIAAAALTMNPALAWLQAAGPVVGALKGESGPSRSDAGQSGQFTFDSSGWAVDFGEGSATATSQKAGFPWWIVPASVAGLALIVWARRH